jgi:hypothetical protein
MYPYLYQVVVVIGASIAKKKAAQAGGVAMTRFAVAIVSFLLMFMAPVTLSFAINHRICFLQDT